MPVTLVNEIGPLIAKRSPGDTISLKVRPVDQPDAEREVSVVLGAVPEEPNRAAIGVYLQTADLQMHFPFDVELDSGNVIGPSAGLAWTLGTIDRLTAGDLTGGKKVAVTGTVDGEGNVGPIGGIAQKVKGAMEAGATAFLYPDSTTAAEVRRMKSIAGDALVMRPVKSVDDALSALANLGGDRVSAGKR
jgi:PDZ domain-containing protein